MTIHKNNNKKNKSNNKSHNLNKIQKKILIPKSLKKMINMNPQISKDIKWD